MTRFVRILRWFSLTDLGLSGLGPLAVVGFDVVGEAERILRDRSA